MAASDHLSPDQFHVFRGLQTGKVYKEALGVHWTDNPDVAEDFGSGKGIGGYSRERSSYSGPYSVIHATASKHDVETNHDKLQEYGVASDVDEDEVPLKEGAKVKVHSITKVNDTRERMRRYNPPREMET